MPPEVTLDLSSHVTTVGGSVEFFCKVEGSSPITYSWKKERTPIHPGQGNVKIIKTFSLEGLINLSTSNITPRNVFYLIRI